MNSAHRSAARHKRSVLFNPVAVAIGRVAVLTDAERASRVIPYHEAMHRLQFGGFGENDWRNLADCLNFGETLAKPPFNLANDHAEKFTDAQEVLAALAEQFRERRTWTARAHQLQALRDAVEMHEIQLRYAGAGELLDAERIIINRVRGALANPGSCIVVEALQ